MRICCSRYFCSVVFFGTLNSDVCCLKIVFARLNCDLFWVWISLLVSAWLNSWLARE